MSSVPGNPSDVREFRASASSWIAAHLPRADHADGPVADDETLLEEVTRDRRLQRMIFDAGFAGIRYPKRYGGLGLTRAHQLAWAEAGVGHVLPTTFNVTHGILGPTILDCGTEEQKARHVPAMLRGEELWVQFLSEPSGGSDLAGLLTVAVREGDHFLVNGSKIWSTGAHVSDYALLLARTNLDVPKHRGLSMLIVPIRQPGLSVTPIQLATGASDFCQEFFDDVVVPVENLVGDEDDGWRVTTQLLFHERNLVGTNSFNDHVTLWTGRDQSEDELVSLARELGLTRDPHVRQLLGEALAIRMLMPPTIERVNALLGSGALPGPGAAILKVLGSVSALRRHRIGIEISGSEAVAWREGDPGAASALRWLAARTTTIAGGTNEIQLNQISERVLGLPREPSPDRDVPFREVLARRRRRDPS